ncbi:MAG: phosphoheptose isomerase [Ignavibacteria bacterium RBG_13_36_8]|nr:MAG: phosphoheptose isomerase [Ignavibacteria bacterium RBG_13_36_8]
MDKKKFIYDSLWESSEVKLKMDKECSETIAKAVDIICKSIKNGGKILLCGNGGSAADCQHIAAEFMIRLSHDITRPSIPAIALTTDTSNLTAGGNDIGFENVFARGVEGLGHKGDVLIVISTSGNSPNIVKAVIKAKLKDMKVIGLLGGSGGKLLSTVDIPIVIPSANVQRIQEGHNITGHIICELVERELYGTK